MEEQAYRVCDVVKRSVNLYAVGMALFNFVDINERLEIINLRIKVEPFQEPVILHPPKVIMLNTGTTALEIQDDELMSKIDKINNNK